MSTVIAVNGKARSSCCEADIEYTKDYTDTHVFAPYEADVDENGDVVRVRYSFVKTYDGMDGTNTQVTCSACGISIDTDGVDFYEE